MTEMVNFTDQPALVALADDSAPVWLWSPKTRQIVWANRTGLAFWGHNSLAGLAGHSANNSHGFRHLDRLGVELDMGRSRVERLRFFRRGRDLPLTCKVSALEFGGEKFLLAHSLGPVAISEIIWEEPDSPGEWPVSEQGSDVPLDQDQASWAEDARDDTPTIEAPIEPESDETTDSADTALGPNVVPFRGQDPDDPSSPSALTGDEEDAFQAIADALNSGKQDTIDWGEAPVDGMEPASDQGGPDQTIEFSDFQGLIEKLSAACFIYRVGGNDGDSEALFASRAYLDLFGFETMAVAIVENGINALLPVSPPTGEGADDRRIVTITRADMQVLPVLARLHKVDWDGGAALMMTLTDQVPGPPPAMQEPDTGIDLGRVFDKAFEAAIILDEAGNILHFNDNAAELFNLEAGAIETESLTIADLLANGDADGAPELLIHFADPGDRAIGTGHEVVGKVYGGADIPLFMKLRQIPDGGIAAFCATFTDISRWQEMADNEAKARAVAEDANEKKSEFMVALSHEIRTSLNPVLGFSEAIMEEHFGPFEHEQYAGYIKDIYESGTHLLALVNDMLDLSKIEAGHADLNFTSVNINEVANTCVKLMQPDANKERIIIRSNLGQDMPEIVADEQSLRQITLNLLSNAVKYTGPGGQVIVSTRMTDDGEQQLRVRDTGRGMSQEDLDVAVQPFGRAETVRDNIAGSGLGLPLTNALIEANRARFEIHSKAGEGTLVEVTFPVNRVLAG